MLYPDLDDFDLKSSLEGADYYPLVKELNASHMPVLVRILQLTSEDPDLKSSLEGGGPRSGGGCWSLHAGKADALK